MRGWLYHMQMVGLEYAKQTRPPEITRYRGRGRGVQIKIWSQPHISPRPTQSWMLLKTICGEATTTFSTLFISLWKYTYPVFINRSILHPKTASTRVSNPILKALISYNNCIRFWLIIYKGSVRFTTLQRPFNFGNDRSRTSAAVPYAETTCCKTTCGRKVVTWLTDVMRAWRLP